MKRRLIYRPEAVAELDQAAAYTRRTWGEQQGKRYIAALVTDIKALRLSAMRYPLYEQIIPGLRRKRSGMHHIYYVTSADRVEIVRIMHVQRDPGLHLKAETWRNGE
ncbi:MAG: type II toxin-antitoxin system RelE/ParE family toxin [Sphingomonadales bacterium]|nr:type II toxin-antitoxin system RelE/ParE family toxin [Sphingomonadales bacterium]